MNSRNAMLMKLGALCASMLLWNAATAEDYPSKPVRIIVPLVPGSGADIMVRLYTPKLTDSMGQQFIVDNRSGAAGNIGAETAARAAPDGYTLLAITASHAISQSLYKNLSYDLVRDFAPVALLASTPLVLAVHPSVPAKNVAELIAYAKANPGKLTFGSAGSGSGAHLTGELFKMQAHVNILHVPYKGTTPAITALIGGEISMIFAANVLPHVRAGRLRALAMTSAKRSLAAPDLPTISESGVPGFESSTWFAILAPAKTPKAAISRLNAAITKIESGKEMPELLMSQVAAEPMGGTPEQVGAHIRSEIVKWRKVVDAANIHMD